MTGVPWYFGVVVDHIYEDCPNRMKARASLERFGRWKQGRGPIDPLGTDVCGWCRRVWVSHQKAGIE